jgi:hypothetical protein
MACRGPLLSLTLVFATGLVLAPSARAADAARPNIRPVRAARPPVIDGRLDDEAWQDALLPLGEWLTYNPLNGEKLAQSTEVRAAYDDRNLYFAFHCVDPEPAGVRGSLSRRDNMWNDDWVGLGLDSVGKGQSSYDLFVNPLGVQGDILNSVSAGENSAPDFVWESAGRRTEQGYDVELRMPLTTIRFRSGADVRMGVIFWRRVSRLGMSASWPVVPAGHSFFQEHAEMVLQDLKQPLTLELIPSATYSNRSTRVSRTDFGPADSQPDAGLSVKYGVTSSATVEGTINPDFSQVESDAYQVEVNQRFPLFFSEKRPFFMEGLGTFELAGVGGDAVMRTAVHTRRIVDPLWGAKATGSAGNVSFAFLAAGDQAPGHEIDGEINPFLGERKDFGIARAQYGLGRSSYAGVLLTDTEFASGHNRVAGGDLSLRSGPHSLAGSFIATTTTSPDGREDKHGLGGGLIYGYETKGFVVASQMEHYDRGFQMDTAFLNQVGITQGWTYVAPSFYPDPKKLPWFKRITPFVYAQYGHDEIQRGNPWIGVTGVRMNFTRQAFLRVDTIFGQEPFVGRTFRVSNTRVFLEGQFTRWFNVVSRAFFGHAIFYDPADPFLGQQNVYSIQATLQPTARLSQSITYDRVTFDRFQDGGRVFTVDVVNTKTTFQVDRRFAVRGIVQYDGSAHRILTDFLASWELRPGTVAYAGYGSLIERQQWDGTTMVPGVGPYTTAQRGFFLKASYIYRF